MTDSNTLIEFPCDFTLKVIGTNSDHFIESVTAVVLRHYPATLAGNIVPRQSGKGNYTALTVTVHCLDKPSLDALYQDLSGLPAIKMVL